MPDCSAIDGQICTEAVRHRYVWAWGEEGFCCDGHRGALESRASQLGRGLQFTPLYNAPTLDGPYPIGDLLTPSAAELEGLKSQIRQREKKIAELERDREVTTEKIRGLELRVAELTKQVNESAGPSTSREVIEGAETGKKKK
jgi:hypothetical protein